jgi:hypothetical protein
MNEQDDRVPHDTSDPTPDHRQRSRTLLATLVAACVLALVVAVAIRADGDDSSSAPVPSVTTPASLAPDDSSSESTNDESDSVDSSGQGSAPSSTSSVGPTSTAPTSEPAAPTEPVEPPDVSTATETIDDLLSTTVEAINSDPSDTSDEPDELPDLDQVAIGAMYEEIEATRVEFEAMNWTQIGTPTIADLRIVAPPTEAAPNDAVVEICLDSSGVRIVDSSGNDVRTTAAPARSLNIYLLRWLDDRWVAAAHTFPDDPTC